MHDENFSMFALIFQFLLVASNSRNHKSRVIHIHKTNNVMLARVPASGAKYESKTSRRLSCGLRVTAQALLDVENEDEPNHIPEEALALARRRGQLEEGDASTVSSKMNVQPLMSFVRTSCGILVNDTRFRIFISLLIVTNAIAMGAATYPFVRGNPKTMSNFDMMDQIFLIIYTIEFILQLIYRGYKLFFDGWLLFDFFIIIISWGFNSLAIVRSFRIFRVLRLIGRLEALKMVVDALLIVIPKLLYITLFLLLEFYIFTVLFTEFFKTMYEKGQTEVDYFSRLDVTAFTLFQVMCLDDWGDIAREVTATYWYASLLFVLFLLFTTFSILNMFIAVFCKAVHELEQIRIARSRRKKINKQEPVETIEEELDNCIQEFLEQEEDLTKSWISLAKSQRESIQKIYSISQHIVDCKNNSNDSKSAIDYH